MTYETMAFAEQTFDGGTCFEVHQVSLQSPNRWCAQNMKISILQFTKSAWKVTLFPSLDNRIDYKSKWL